MGRCPGPHCPGGHRGSGAKGAHSSCALHLPWQRPGAWHAGDRRLARACDPAGRVAPALPGGGTLLPGGTAGLAKSGGCSRAHGVGSIARTPRFARSQVLLCCLPPSLTSASAYHPHALSPRGHLTLLRGQKRIAWGQHLVCSKSCLIPTPIYTRKPPSSRSVPSRGGLLPHPCWPPWLLGSANFFCKTPDIRHSGRLGPRPLLNL